MGLFINRKGYCSSKDSLRFSALFQTHHISGFTTLTPLPLQTVTTWHYQPTEDFPLKRIRIHKGTQSSFTEGQSPTHSNSLTGEMHVQASPFVTRKHHIPDPHDDGEGYCWVSIILPPEVKNGTHSDETIMLFVIHKCKAGQTAMTHQPPTARARGPLYLVTDQVEHT